MNITEQKEIAIEELARSIREEHSLFWAYHQAYEVSPGSLKAIEVNARPVTVLHRQNVAELLRLARSRFASEVEWQEWLQKDCWMAEGLADYFMRPN